MANIFEVKRPHKREKKDPYIAFSTDKIETSKMENLRFKLQEVYEFIT